MKKAIYVSFFLFCNLFFPYARIFCMNHNVGNHTRISLMQDLNSFLFGLVDICMKRDRENRRNTIGTLIARKKFYRQLKESKEQNKKCNEELKKEYHSKLALQRDSEWDLEHRYVISAAENLKRKEEYICKLLDNTCKESNKGIIKEIILDSNKTLINAILGILLCFSRRKEDFTKAYALLNQFPRVRDCIFSQDQQVWQKNKQFEKFLQELKKQTYECVYSRDKNYSYTPYKKAPPTAVKKILEKLREQRLGTK